MEPLVLPSRAQRDVAFTLTVAERTRRLRRRTIARHLARAPAHLKRPLDELLRRFAATCAVGKIGAFHYCDWRWGDEIEDEELDPDFGSPEFSDFHIFAWGPITVAMMLLRLGREGPIAREVVSGLEAAGDRARGFVDEIHLIEAADDTVLPELFDILGAAYATGAAVALGATCRRAQGRRADGDVSDGWLARMTSAIASMGTVEQALIDGRYAQRMSADEISAAWIASGASRQRWGQETMPGSLAEVLATAHAWARIGASSRARDRTLRP